MDDFLNKIRPLLKLDNILVSVVGIFMSFLISLGPLFHLKMQELCTFVYMMVYLVVSEDDIFSWANLEAQPWVNTFVWLDIFPLDIKHFSVHQELCVHGTCFWQSGNFL